MWDDALSRLIIRELGEIDGLLGKSSALLATPCDAEPSFERLAALSTILTSFYTGIERIFERIASCLDPTQPEGERRHIELLNQVARPSSNRPAVISEESRQRLRDYLAFHHRSRHAYAHHLEWRGMEHLVTQIQETWDGVRPDVVRFVQQQSTSTDRQ